MIRTSKVLILIFVLGLVTAALSGCGTPGPGKVLDSAIEWVEDSDSQAISNTFGTQSWWLYQRGGRTMTGLAGTIVIDGDIFYVRTSVAESAGEQAAAPQWVRFSRQDLEDEKALERAKPILAPLVAASVIQPLLAMQAMAADSEVGETNDEKAWIVTGIVATSAQLEQLLGKDAASRYIQAGLEPDIQRAVTVVVDKKTGRPLETTIQVSAEGPAEVVSYTWMRGLWLPPDEDTIDLNEYLK